MFTASPEKIFFGIPLATRMIDFACSMAIHRTLARTGGNVYFHAGLSEIALARNVITQRFKQSDCDWFMMIDSDIVFSEDDWNYLWEGSEDVVTASYARKIPGKSPANYGLGFTRVHRRVFDKIDNLMNESGTMEIAARFYMDGAMHVNYFPGGVTGDSRWLGEDRAFFTLCQIAEIEHRLETRCQLQHVGSFLYGYPDQSNGAQFFKPESDEENQDMGDRSVVIM